MDKAIIISGQAVGFGSDNWRYVRGLSDEAKAALKDNSALVICPRNFNDQHGLWYVVTVNRGRYGHRLPNDAEREIIRAAM